MSLFVDTSAFYALLVSTERRHEPVARELGRALKQGVTLVTTSYVVVETTALLQHRVGLEAVLDFEDSLLPILEVTWVDRDLHAAAMARLRRSGLRRVSLVDCTSFELMRRRGLTKALTLDAHFADAGFDVIPST